MANEDDTTMQESPAKKSTWREITEKSHPIGTLVKVIASDIPEYVGHRGRVVDYDVGVYGEYPMVGVEFSEPVGGTARDGFYVDELEILKEE